MELIISIALCAAVCAVCNVFTAKLLKEKEKPLSEREKILLPVITSVICLAAAIVFPLMISRDTLNIYLLLRTLCLFWISIFCGFIDYKLMIIPNRLLLIALGAVVLSFSAEALLDWISFQYEIFGALLGCAVCFVIFFIGRVISRRGMGMGDIKLAALIGLTVGMDSALGVLLWSVMLAAFIGGILILCKKAKAKTKIAMAPFFCMGLLVSHIMLIISENIGGNI